ncbi:hypothetical protein TCAL_02429 [Tigriopus californicus]|uniref:C2H2-type domain-containing protein n=1 Tax=Tigriopus californicus TaxID=6832 RepID=A0A553NZY5_TIGCA|nr:zinc finger protein 718-like [Tigriopus californicus]TRY70999.1 hypothetical protein TCAL_02429 [Tigriopus californicus]
MPSHTYKDSDWRSQNHFGMSIKFWQLSQEGESFSVVLPETPYLRQFLRSLMSLMKTDLDLSESIMESVANVLSKFLVKEEVYQLDELVAEAAKMHQLLDEGTNCILTQEAAQMSLPAKDAMVVDLLAEPTSTTSNMSFRSWSPPGEMLRLNPAIKSLDKGIQCDVIGEKEVSGSDSHQLESGKLEKSINSNHRPRKRDQRTQQEPSSTSFPCQFRECGEIFDSRKNLTAHVKRSHGKLFCSTCKCIFWQGKENHLCIRGKAHECKDCGKRFNGSKDLKNHTYTHSKEKPYVCDVCQKGFSQQATLSRHKMAVHVGEKRFECDKCDKKFSLKQYLDKHLRKHSGEKPFVCDHCGLAFSQNGNLRKHARLIHREELNFVCDTCGDSFVQLSYLERHKKMANH